MAPGMKARAAELLLEELKAGKEQWYYISVVHVPTLKKSMDMDDERMAKEAFMHGVVVPGCGPTDAWFRFQGLNLCPPDCETETHGPIPEHVLTCIPTELRLCKLTRVQAENLGK